MLLSLKTASDLEVLKLNLNVCAVTKNLDPSAKLFHGIGKLKDFQVQLQIDQTVKPYKQKLRSTLINLQKNR